MKTKQQTDSAPLEYVVSRIWAYGNRCRKLHIVPEHKFMPALCGFTPKGSPGGTVAAEWVVVNDQCIEDAFNNKTPKYENTLCEKCLRKTQSL